MMRKSWLVVLALAACSTEHTAHGRSEPFTPSGKQEVAIVAGGCFWGMENVMRKAPGIL